MDNFSHSFKAKPRKNINLGLSHTASIRSSTSRKPWEASRTSLDCLDLKKYSKAASSGSFVKENSVTRINKINDDLDPRGTESGENSHRSAQNTRVCDLEKELNRVMLKFDQERKYFLQKIELMDMKLKEAQEREQSIEKLHNTMMKALKEDNASEKENQFVKQFEFLSDQHKRELADAEKTYEFQLGHLNQKNNELQEKCTNLTESCSSMQKEIKRIITENTELEKQILILKKDQEIEKRVEIEKFVKQTSVDRENIETKCKIELDKINEDFKTKEERLMEQLSQANQEIELLRKDSSDKAQNNIIMSSEKFTRMSKENDRLKKENARLKRHSKTFEKQIDQMKNAPVQFMNLAEEEESLVSVLKLNHKLEKRLSQKDDEIEEMAQNFNNALTGESKKVESLKEKLSKNRDKYEERRGKLLKTIAAQEDQIEQLKRKFKDASSKASTPSSKQWGDHNGQNFSNTEMTLLRMCQNMVDSASSMECRKCNVCLEPTAFHEHITNKNECPGNKTDDYDFTMRLEDDVSTIPNTDKNMNLYSNKSSKMELLNFGLHRPRSVSRKDFQFGPFQNPPSTSFVRQSINPTASCLNFESNLNNTCQNPMAMSMSRPVCQSVMRGLSCSGQFNQGFGSILAQHNQIMASQTDLHPSHTVSNERVVAKLETTENMLRNMDLKVDQIQKEKHAYAKQLKKLTKRFSNSVSTSRDGLIFTARSPGFPSSKKAQNNRNIDDSQVNLHLSDTNGTPKSKPKMKKSNSRYQKESKQRELSRKESPRYTKMFGKYEREQEISINSSIETTTNNFTAVNTSGVKHAVADLGDDSNDYTEDMDESVAFSKRICSGKENQETLKEYSTKHRERVVSKRPKKLAKTNRNDLSNQRKKVQNSSSISKNPKGMRKISYYDKRRGSYLK
ncbi:unnamed protein product [Moneuplotes crassus]|uniref:Uncharacterized protein n=1 Tax=Euplotes crassus TaxID=5936 RepID=A0AAD2D948_EUPCR|nr:unnamed protein product [Moneuplotes crassus]